MNTDIHTLAGAYALDAIDDIERAQFDRHLAGCLSCALEVDELRLAAGRLADLTTVVPPPRLKDAVLAEVSRTRQVGPARSPGSSGRSAAGWRRWTAVAVAAGVVAIGAASATFVVQEQRVRDAQAQSAQAQQVAAILSAPDAVMRVQPVAGGRVTVVVSDSLDQGVAFVNGLASPGGANAYQLWVIKDAPKDVGILAAGSGDGTKVFTGVRGASGFGVSQERASGATTPTTPLVTSISFT